MPTRTFETEKIIEWGLHEWEDCEHVLHFAHLYMHKFEVRCELVFRAPDDGKIWRFEFAVNNGAGYNEISGTTYGADAKAERFSFEAVEVEPRDKVVTVYEPAQDFGPMTPDALVDLLGLVMVPDEIPAAGVLEELTQAELDEVGQWCTDIHCEASDIDIKVGPMPACLRDRLPAGHTYKEWRVGEARP